MTCLARHFLLIALCLMSITCSAQQQISTLKTEANDKITIDYVVKYENGRFAVNFKSPKIEQEKNHGGKEQHVVFFQSIGKYKDNTVFQGKNYEPMSTPPAVTTTQCGYGYMDLMDGNPKVTFTATEDCDVTIPIYLVEKEKKMKNKGKGVKFNYLTHTTEPLVVKLIRPKSSQSQSQKKKTHDGPIASDPSFDEMVVDDIEEPGVMIESGDNSDILDNISPDSPGADPSNPNGSGASQEPLNPDALRSLKEKIDKSESLDDLESLSSQIESLRERQLTSSESAPEIKSVIDAYDNKLKMFKAKEKETQKKKELLYICLAVFAVILGFVIKPAYNEYRRWKEKKEQEDMMRRAEKEAKDAQRRAERKAQKMLNQNFKKTRVIKKI